MTTKIYHPRIEIRAFKVVQRREIMPGRRTSSRYSEGDITEIDLTPFLGDGSSVRVVTDVKAPAGAFAISVVDAPKSIKIGGDGKTVHVESLTYLLEPADLVEIRIAHDPSEYAKAEKGYRLPVIMRGVISEVRRRRGVDGQGRPHRTVVITGQNLIGRAWQALRIMYFNNHPLGDLTLSTFKFLQKYDPDGDIARNPSTTEFMSGIIKPIIEEFLGNMKFWGKRLAREFSKVSVECTAQGRVQGMIANTFESGSLYRFIAFLTDADSGLNELYSESREDGEYIVLRSTPWRTPDRKFIQSGTPSIDVVELTDDDIVSIESTRTDQGTANYFYAKSAAWWYGSDTALRLTSDLLPETDYPNNNPAIYGHRLLEADIALGPPDYEGSTDRIPVDQRETYDQSVMSWLADRRRALQEATRDAAVFERGALVCRGNEKLRAGIFVRVKEGDLVYEVYAARVEHQFTMFQGFTTVVHFERSDAFIQRSQRDVTPYWGEMTQKARGLK
ncbi:hypothetical protein [Methylocaldum sp.]|uniref:hypothetical protein n=1 Tax=Methylocaldum sp. TaxID=1969727 RepID=UPI002D6FAA40|nr:hypothetical protein [Methylocaldum sp.]HYE36124.1 hypothetical protein [Methylocaldum sp.]